LGCLPAALALYELLKGAGRNLGALMVMLGGLMPCVLDFVNAWNPAP